MTNFSQKPAFNLAEFLDEPASAAEIKRATDARRRRRELLERLESERMRRAPAKAAT